jgi:hypothetical protein
MIGRLINNCFKNSSNSSSNTFFNLNKNKRQKINVFASILGLALFLFAADHTLSILHRLKQFFSVVYDVLAEFKPTVSRNISDVRLLLWTRKAPLKYYELRTGDITGLSISNYNRSNPTKILVHGFSDRGLTGWVKTFKKHYLERDDINVISVDWELLAESPWYTTAAKNSRHVGKHVAEFIVFLISEGARYESFHILGTGF